MFSGTQPTFSSTEIVLIIAKMVFKFKFEKRFKVNNWIWWEQPHVFIVLNGMVQCYGHMWRMSISFLQFYQKIFYLFH